MGGTVGADSGSAETSKIRGSGCHGELEKGIPDCRQTGGRGKSFSPSAARSHRRVLSWEGCDLTYFFRHCPSCLVEEGGGRLERKLEPRWEVLRCCGARLCAFPCVPWHLQAKQPGSLPGGSKWKSGLPCTEKQRCGESLGETHSTQHSRDHLLSRQRGARWLV